MKLLKYFIAAVTAAFICAAALVSGCYAYDSYKTGEWGIIKIKPGGEYVVTNYVWDGTEAGTVCTIPDEYDGHKITRIGAETMLCPFGVQFPDELDGMGLCSLSKTDDEVSRTQAVTFTITLNKYIKVLDSCLTANQYYQTADGGYVKYEINFCFCCSDENQTFYAENGMLYYKANGALAEWENDC